MNNQNIKLEPEHLKFIKNQNNCGLCENELEIYVENYLETDTIKEEAHCPSCNIKARIKDYKMQ